MSRLEIKINGYTASVDPAQMPPVGMPAIKSHSNMQFKTTELPNLGQYGGKILLLEVENTFTGERAQQTVEIKPGVALITVVMDFGLGSARSISFQNNSSTPDEENLDGFRGMLEIMNERLHFSERLLDLFVFERIKKDEFLKLRAMFKSDNNEDRTMAITMVKRQHQKYIES